MRREITHWLTAVGVACHSPSGDVSPFMSKATCPECMAMVQAQLDRVGKLESPGERFRVR